MNRPYQGKMDSEPTYSDEAVYVDRIVGEVVSDTPEFCELSLDDQELFRHTVRKAAIAGLRDGTEFPIGDKDGSFFEDLANEISPAELQRQRAPVLGRVLGVLQGLIEQKRDE